jgi:large subunit ribosomal protein L10
MLGVASHAGDGADNELKAMQDATAVAPAVQAEKAEAGEEPEAEQDEASEEDAVSGLGAMFE